MLNANTWAISGRSSGGAATATQSAPTNGAAGGTTLRLRAIQAIIQAGGSNTSDRLVVRDGATGVGAIIFSMDLNALANSNGLFQASNLDLRATAGNALTVEFVTGTGNAEDVNAQGDT